MTPQLILAAILAVAALLAIARLLIWQRRAPAALWRITALIALQPLFAGLLYLTLVPPLRPGSAGTLVIATAGTPRLTALAVADALVTLPESADIPGAERAPDLATALRRHPGTTALRILGSGLAARDRPAAAGLPLTADPAPLPRGLIALAVPTAVAPGSNFAIAGTAHDLAGGSADLIDPAGAVAATASLAADGSFRLGATARVAGPADFRLRLRDSRRAVIETTPVPVVVAVQAPPKILVVAGSAGPDLKYLRRWATDAGLDLRTSIAAGAGLDIGDAPPRLDAGSLAGLDLLVLDERSWAALGPAQRGAVLGAVRTGLGLLLRVTGPLPDAVRRDWAARGLPVGDSFQPLRLPAAAADAKPPELTRLRPAGSDSDLAPWRSFGRGRIGLMPVTDLYGLVLAGDTARHAGIWSDVFAALARPAPTAPRIPAEARPGERLALCDLPSPASVLAPDGGITALVPDPQTPGCAAFWPARAGWHTLRTGPADTAALFAVTPPAPGIVAAENAAATWALQGAATPQAAATPARGPSWPWFLAWLTTAALLWWLERSRLGRTAKITRNPA